MSTKPPKVDVGAIVGRFQVHELTAGHIDLIQSVVNKHDRVIIFLGNAPIRSTYNNPLDYGPRRKMIEAAFPTVEVHYIDDTPNDEQWSKNLDRQIAKLLNAHQKILLYGSRDSFLKQYKGKYPTCEHEATVFTSGTEIRRRVCNNYPANADYRAGVIAGTAMRYPTAFQTVDIAVFSEDGTRLLLARKPDETGWRFIGGFSDPRSESLEADARREVQEEACIEIGGITYLFSTKVDDWRYRGEIDCIKTAMFAAKYISGRPTGADDIAEVAWFKVDDLNVTMFVDTHKPLFIKLTDPHNAAKYQNLFTPLKGLMP